MFSVSLRAESVCGNGFERSRFFIFLFAGFVIKKST